MTASASLKKTWKRRHFAQTSLSLECLRYPATDAWRPALRYLALAENFLERCASRNQTALASLAEHAVLALQQHSPPGNVRELEHLMKRAAVQAGSRVITFEQMEHQLTAAQNKAKPAPQDDTPLPFHDFGGRLGKSLDRKFPNNHRRKQGESGAPARYSQALTVRKTSAVRNGVRDQTMTDPVEIARSRRL